MFSNQIILFNAKYRRCKFIILLDKDISVELINLPKKSVEQLIWVSNIFICTMLQLGVLYVVLETVLDLMPCFYTNIG